MIFFVFIHYDFDVMKNRIFRASTVDMKRQKGTVLQELILAGESADFCNRFEMFA